MQDGGDPVEWNNTYIAVADLRGGGGGVRGGGVRTPHISWVRTPSPGTLPPWTLFIINVKFCT